MADHLQPLGATTRRIAALACVPAALISAALTALLAADMALRGEFNREGKPLWLAAVLLGVITVVSGWLALRLWSGRTTNGVTTLPVWFLEAFGALFLLAIVGLWGAGGGVGISAAAVGVAVAMLCVRRAVRSRTPRPAVSANSSGPQFRLVLLNDDAHSYGYVVELLRREFGLTHGRALALTRVIDGSGRAVVFVGPRDEVEWRRDRVLAAGPDAAVPASSGSLRVLVEEAD